MISSIINESHYWLKNAHIPVCLLDQTQFLAQTREGLCNVDLEINSGIIQQVIHYTINYFLEKYLLKMGVSKFVIILILLI